MVKFKNRTADTHFAYEAVQVFARSLILNEAIQALNTFNSSINVVDWNIFLEIVCWVLGVFWLLSFLQILLTVQR